MLEPFWRENKFSINMDEKNLEIAKSIIQELLEQMGFQAELEIGKFAEDNQENIICNIKVSEDSNLLIGQYGVNLQSLQHIARLLVRKKIEDKFNFILDINSYRQEKNQSVVEQAQSAAEQALSEGRAIILKPMTSYERRIVHMELAKNDKVKTESIGEGEERKVIVKPANLI
jgi:spoIIIJ-associated protein